MLHKVILNAAEFAQGLKDCAVYADKNGVSNSTDYITLALQPKTRKLSMIACDGKGLYERKIPAVNNKKKDGASLPGENHRLMLAFRDLSSLAKFVGTNVAGNATLVVDDAEITDTNYVVRVTLDNGSSTIFMSDRNITPIDYADILHRAENTKKSASFQNNMLIPAIEIIRLAKVLPKKGAYSEVGMFTSKMPNGLLTLVEYQNNEDVEIRIVFISRLAKEESRAA